MKVVPTWSVPVAWLPIQLIDCPDRGSTVVWSGKSTLTLYVPNRRVPMGKMTPPTGPPNGVVRAGIVSVVGHAPVWPTVTVNAPPCTSGPRVGGTVAQLSGDLIPTHNPSGF